MGNSTLGFAILIVAFVLMLALFATIEPFKESLDEVRGNPALNCPGTPNHNATAYGEDDSFNRLTRRPTCFVTGITMVYFIGSFLIALVAWVGVSWRRLS